MFTCSVGVFLGDLLYFPVSLLIEDEVEKT